MLHNSSILIFSETFGAECGIPEIFYDLHSLPSITLNHPHPHPHPHWNQLQDLQKVSFKHIQQTLHWKKVHSTDIGASRAFGHLNN